MIIVAFFTLLLGYSLAGRLYSSRSELNETVHSKTRHAVSNFINTHQMNLLDHFIRKHKSLFERSTFGGRNYFVLSDLKYEVINDGIFSISTTESHETNNVTAFIKNRVNNILRDNPRHINENNNKRSRNLISPTSSEIHSESNSYEKIDIERDESNQSPADQSVSILRDLSKFGPLSHVHKSQLVEFENYVHVRDKILEYASEALNKTIYAGSRYDGVTFYYFPPKPNIEIKVNGRGYVFAPHTDTRVFPPTYDRPLEYDMSRERQQPYRKYTAVLFFTDTTPETGGLFEWLDFPNNFNLSPVKGKRLGSIKDPSYARDVLLIHSPSFDDPDFKATTIIPERAKLLLFHAEDDIHGSREYMGEVERWAFVMQLTDAQGRRDDERRIIPSYVKTKVAPVLNVKDPHSGIHASDHHTGTSHHPSKKPLG